MSRFDETDAEYRVRTAPRSAEDPCTRCGNDREIIRQVAPPVVPESDTDLPSEEGLIFERVPCPVCRWAEYNNYDE